MSGLHLVRLAVDARALTAFAITNHADDDDHGYAAHLALRRRFGPAAPQPFRLFTDRATDPYLLGYTAAPEVLIEASALPPVDRDLDLVFPIPPMLRPMPEVWRDGGRFAFEVRVRPVVRFGGRVRARRMADDKAWQRRAGEIDAFVAACAKAPAETFDREAIYLDWLIARFADTAEIGRAVPGLMRRLVTRRSRHGKPGPPQIEGYEAVFNGDLTVTSGDAFAQLLARGVGRHTAFGFGMLLLSPPGRRAA